MFPVITLLIVSIILPVALLLDRSHPVRLDEAIADWADNHGYVIRDLRLHPRTPEMRFNLCSQIQRLYLVEVADPDDRVLRFVVKTGVYFLGGGVKRLQAYSVDSIVAA